LAAFTCARLGGGPAPFSSGLRQNTGTKAPRQSAKTPKRPAGWQRVTPSSTGATDGNRDSFPGSGPEGDTVFVSTILGHDGGKNVLLPTTVRLRLTTDLAVMNMTRLRNGHPALTIRFTRKLRKKEIHMATIRTAILAIGILGAFAGILEARGLPAFMGQAQNFADGASFSNNMGRVVNYAATTKQWCIAIPMSADSNTNPKTISPSISIYAPDINHVPQCNFWSTDGWGNLVASSGWLSPSTMGQNVSMSMGTFTTYWGNAPYFACCNLPYGARFNSIGY
jgi:hypothetical protein